MVEKFSERRKDPRFGFRIPVRYRKLGTVSQEFKGSLMRDISTGGARMTIYEFLPLNLRLAAEIPLISASKPFAGVCRVAWVKKTAFSEQYDVGVEFLELKPEDKTQVGEFVQNTFATSQ